MYRFSPAKIPLNNAASDSLESYSFSFYKLSNSNEEIDIFANTNDLMTIETKELIPEHERIYQDDRIYIED